MMSESEYQRFLQSLSSLSDKLEDLATIPDSEEFEFMLIGIKEIKRTQLEHLYNMTGISQEQIENDLNLFFESIFLKVTSPFCEILKKSTGNFFFVKKSFQLSHAHALHKDILNDKGELGDYFFLQLYTDCYETLTNRFRGLYRAFHESKPSMELVNSKEFYANLLKDKPSKILEYIQLNEELRSYRDRVNEGRLLCGSGKLEVIRNLQKAIDFGEDTDIDEIGHNQYFHRLRGLMVFLVLFSTEFDLRFFQLIQNKDFEEFSHWVEYFKIYKESWDTQKSISGN